MSIALITGATGLIGSEASLFLRKRGFTLLGLITICVASFLATKHPQLGTKAD